MSNLKKMLCASCILTTIATGGAYKLGFDNFRPGAISEQGYFERHDAAFMDRCGKARITSAVGDPVGSYHWPRCEAVLNHYQTRDAFMLRHNMLSMLAGLSLLSFLGFARIAVNEAPKPKVVRGRKHLEGKEALRELKKLSRASCDQSGEGICFPPGIPMSTDRESRHFLIWGSTGAGKTQAMLCLMLQAIARGDKVLILDVKGDMMSSLPQIGNLIAPHDKRSLQWDISKDCFTKQDARELAARLIPQSHDPVWSDAARSIFVACIVALQSTRSGAWNWADLRDLVVSDAGYLLDIARKFHPDAVQFLKEPTSKSTHSFISTFKAHMNIVSMLADAWPESTSGRSFAIKDWLKHPLHHPVILQHDGRYPELSKAWISGIIGLLASHAGSPSMPENPKRRTWLLLDEFPQLERLEHFSTLLDVGRSKGISVVLGAQDISQIRKTYGHDQADAWIGMIGTHILTRMNLGQGAEVASRMIGNQTIEYQRKTESQSGSTRTITRSKAQEVRPVMTPSELSDRLGPKPDGIHALLIGPGEHAYEVTLPYINLSVQRPASVLADWTTKSPKQIAPLPEEAPPTHPPYILSPDDIARIKRPNPEDLN